MKEMTDDELMLRVRAGHSDAFETIYQRVAPGLTGYLRNMGLGVHECNDQLQETFLKIWRFRRKYPGSGARSWVYTIARNSALDLFRRNRGREIHSDSTLYSASAEEEVLATELGERLERALRELPEVIREVVLLSRYSKMTLKEIGAVTDQSEGNVKVRLHRGLNTLKETVYE